MVTDVGGRKKRNQFHKLTQNCFSSTSRHKLYHPSSKAKETVADCCLKGLEIIHTSRQQQQQHHLLLI